MVQTHRTREKYIRDRTFGENTRHKPGLRVKGPKLILFGSNVTFPEYKGPYHKLILLTPESLQGNH
jgi:hypothetical protein